MYAYATNPLHSWGPWFRCDFNFQELLGKLYFYFLILLNI